MFLLLSFKAVIEEAKIKQNLGYFATLNEPEVAVIQFAHSFQIGFQKHAVFLWPLDHPDFLL